jgi:hypothetical protein
MYPSPATTSSTPSAVESRRVDSRDPAVLFAIDARFDWQTGLNR